MQPLLRQASSLRALVLTGVVLALVAAVRAHAEGPSTPTVPSSSLPSMAGASAPHSSGEEPASYGQAVDAALEEYHRQHFDEAYVHFMTAHRLFPNARTLRGLGVVEFERRNYGDAIRYLQESLESQVRPLNDEMRADTAQIRSRAKLYVGEVHLDVQPDFATVTVDGVPHSGGPKTSLALVVGDHLLEFHALGRVPARRPIRVEGGQRVVVRLTLESADDPSSRAPAKATPDHEPSRPDAALATRKRRLAWSALGVAVLAGAVTGIVLGVRDRDQTQFESPPPSPNAPVGVVIRALREQ